MKSHFVPARFLTPRSIFTASRSALAGTALFLASTTLPVAAQEVEPEPTLEEASEAQILGVLRSSSPKQLLPKVMEIARQIQPGPQTEALPFILGGMLGDPNLEGISAEANVGVVVVGNETNVTPVILLQLTEGSPLSSSLTETFGLMLEQHDGWTFAVPAGMSLDAVAGREREFIDAVKQPRRYDLEIVANVPAFSEKLREAISPMLEGGMEGEELLATAMEAFMLEAEAVASAGMGLNLSRELIQPVYFVHANEGTAMSAFLDQERPDDLEFAKFIKADSLLAGLGGYDIEATRTYVDYLLGKFDKGAEDESFAVFMELVDSVMVFLDKTEGTSGVVMSMDGMMPDMTSVAPSSFTDAEFQQALADLVAAQVKFAEKGAQEFAQGSMTFTMDTPAYTFTPSVAEIEGLPVHLMTTAVEMPTVDEEWDTTPEEDVEVVTPEKMESYYVLVDGYVVNSSSLDGLRETVAAIQAGEAVPNNLGDLISLDERELFRVNINPFNLVDDMATFPIPAHMQPVLKDLQAQNLPPITIGMSAVDGEAEFVIGIPVKSLAATSKAIQAAQAAQQQQMMEESQGTDEAPTAPLMEP